LLWVLLCEGYAPISCNNFNQTFILEQWAPFSCFSYEMMLLYHLSSLCYPLGSYIIVIYISLGVWLSMRVTVVVLVRIWFKNE
jgi:hypothetical protein